MIRFIFSKLFILQLVLAVIAAGLMVYGTLIYLDYYTLHGQEITVPDLYGMDKMDLKEFLDEKELNYKIIDSVYSVEEEKGIVIGQNPSADSKVKKDRTIYITVNAMNPPSVRLPVLVDKSLRQASSIIQNLGLVVGELIYQPDQCVNCVLAQKFGEIELLSDTSLPKGSKIDLVLGGGLSDEKVLVPLLINLSRDEAIAVLKKSFLNLGAELYDSSVYDDEDTTNSKIFAQHPPYGIESWLPMGSSVDVEYTMMENKIDTNIVILDSSLFIRVEEDSL